MDKKTILLVVLGILVVAGFAGIYYYYNIYSVNSQQNITNDQINSTINSDAFNEASEQDITVDATVDNTSDATVTIIPADNISPERITNYTEENLAYDIPVVNNTTVNTSMIQVQPQAAQTRVEAIISPNNLFQITDMVAKAPLCGSSGDSSSCSTNTSDITTSSNSTLVYPTYDKLITFLENDTTDINGLSDNQAVVTLAQAATNNGYHNQIVLIVFNNSQVFMVNRFALTDGTFAYVDNSKIEGFINNGTDPMDRFLSVYKGQPITSRSPYNDNVKYTYPSTTVEYCIPFWKI